MSKDLKAICKYKRVLVVHNDKKNLANLYMLFKKLFLSVDIAIDYDTGLKKFHERKNKFNLLITDLEMSKFNGFELATKIREEAHFPIIFLYKDRNYLTTELASLKDIELSPNPLNIHKLLETIALTLRDDNIDEYTADTLLHIYKSIIDAIKEIIQTGSKHDYKYHINSIVNFFDYTKKLHEGIFDLEEFKIKANSAKTLEEQKSVFLILKLVVEKILKKYNIFI